MDAASDELIRQTMGTLRKTLLQRRSDIDHVGDLLIRAVRMRNFLAHHYFRARAAAFGPDDGKSKMIGELQHAAEFFEEADGKVRPLVMEIMHTTGFDKHLPDALERAKRSGFGDPLPGLRG
jgi:hypothetical protein